MVVDSRGCGVFTGTRDEINGEIFEMFCSGQNDFSGVWDFNNRFDCHPPTELQPGQWFAECAGETSPKAQYFVSDIWN